MTNTAAPDFRFWIRRSATADAPFSLRFEVRSGRGLLRVARPDVLLDPPASRTGSAVCLTAEEVRASRFLLVADRARFRQGYFLTALGDNLLAGLPDDDWFELAPRLLGGVRLLVPAADAPGNEDTLRLPSKDVTDVVTHPGDGRGRLPDLKEALARRPVTTQPAPGPLDEHVFTGEESEEDARAFLGPSLLSSAPLLDAPPEDSPDDVSLDDPTGRDPDATATLLPDGPPLEEPARPVIPPDLMPRGEEPGAFGPHMGALVRHLRREQQRDRVELTRLRARVAELEAEVERLRGGQEGRPRPAPR